MNQRNQILIIEDDDDINTLLVEKLTQEGYRVQPAYSGTEGLIYFKQQPWDLIILDLMLPGKCGEDLLEMIRQGSRTPVIILSAKGEVESKVKMLKLGADDYLTKPFDLDELSVRVEVQLRRQQMTTSHVTPSSLLIHKDIELNPDTMEVKINYELISLTLREYKLLELLMRYPSKVFSKGNLFESAWGSDYLGDENTLSVHISNLRSKLNKKGQHQDYIQTVWGIGYKLT